MIRTATPADADFLSWAILASSRGHLSRGWFDIAIDLPEAGSLEFLRHLTTTAACSRWHYSRFLIAEASEGPVAALCAFRFVEAYVASPPAVAEAAERMGLSRQQQAAIWKRGAYMFTCMGRPHEDCWVIESTATLPCCRGRGYTSALLSRSLAEARARGLREAEITVVIGNDAAERAYRKAGFHWAGDRCHPEFEIATGASGQRRLVQALC
jgi:ribosomal protein S18 acetylase RimI-like enzyme